MDSVKRILRKTAVGAAVCLLMISTSLSDDIDVYVTPPDAATPGDAFVIFTLDLRPNVLASEVCGSDTAEECEALFNEVGMQEALEGKTTYLELLTAALRKVLTRVNSSKIHVALMVPHNDTTDDDKICVGFQTSTPSLEQRCSNGAYVLSGFTTTSDTAQMEARFFKKLESLPLKGEDEIEGNWGHSYQLKELFFEMYRYVTRGHVFNGENGWNDFKTDSELNIDDAGDTPFGGNEPEQPEPELMWDTDAIDPSSKRYRNSLSESDHCSSVFSVNLVDGTANQDDNSDSAIESDTPAGLGLTLQGSSFRSRVQVLEYLARTDLDPNLVGSQHITSYFVAKPSGGSGDAGGRANDWAQAGGSGSAWTATENPQDLVDDFDSLFNEILGVSTTFVAASVPANVFNRAETLNEVFLAIFEPHEPGDGELPRPFWVGNVKKLTTVTIPEAVDCEENSEDVQECTTGERRILVDVLEAQEAEPTKSAINSQDGRIRADALTYWTQTGTNNEYLPAPTDGEEGADEFTEGTDGRKVDRGGAGQVKPGYLGADSPGETNSTLPTTMSGPRKIFTEADDDDASTDGMVDLDADSDANTAINLLTDGRTYPGSDLTYGAHLYQTVMSDCADCASSYGEESKSQNQRTAEDRVNNLILFARGFEFTDIDTATGGKRPWWQADPLHSRPLALNYGARAGFEEDRPDIRILVSGNDGMLQMIRDGRKSDGSEDGVEAWSFLPREFVPLQKRLLEGDSGTYDPGMPYDTPHKPLHPYAMDGAPTALVIDNNLDGTIDTNDNDQVYAYLGQRRGGKRYYALDLSDPDNPEFLWSIGKNDSGGDFAEMGQSWSLLRAGVMRVEENGTEFNRPVLVFSGGYNGDDGGDGDGDMGKDQRLAPGADGEMGTDDDVIMVGDDDDEGNALFIVNALTGDLIWKVIGPNAENPFTSDDPTTEFVLEHSGLVDSVASSPTVVDSTGNGVIDRVYFPDTGGNVWRMDAGSADRANWTVNKLFAGGRHFQGDTANDRRFFHAPDVVFASDEDGKFDAVILASGDRPHPLGTEVENWIYMIKDRDTTSGSLPHHEDAEAPAPKTHTDLADLTDNCLQSGDTADCGDESESVQQNIVNGWRVQLNQCEAKDAGPDPKCGEKSLASALTIEGTIFLTSYLPLLASPGSATEPPETCGPKEGAGLFYALDLQTAGGVLDFVPSNESGGVEVPDRFDRLKSKGIPPEPVAISPEEVLRPDLQIQKTKGRRSAKTFWYERRFE